MCVTNHFLFNYVTILEFLPDSIPEVELQQFPDTIHSLTRHHKFVTRCHFRTGRYPMLCSIVL